MLNESTMYKLSFGTKFVNLYSAEAEICLFWYLYCHFYTPPHDCGGLLWFYVGRPCVCLSVRRTPYFRFWTITSKYKRTFTKLGMCIDIVEMWFGTANFVDFSYLPTT